MILHRGGLLTDFDLARPLGATYPSTLADIAGDGKRHPDVALAIHRQDGSIQEVAMEFAHDVYSMKYVLQLFTPVDQSLAEEWISAISQEDLPSVIQALGNFSGDVTLIQKIS